MTKTNDEERRNFFRINDEVYIELESITDAEYAVAQDTLDNLEDSTFSLSADFATLNNKFNPILNSIKQQYPDIGEFLDIINKKIDSLSQHVLYDNYNPTHKKPIMANLSASGIQFETTDKYTVKQPVKLELILLPEKVGLLIFGRVVEAKENFISIVFEHLRTEDQELMIKHNLNKQMTELREKKGND